MRVIIVDDQSSFRRQLRQLLDYAGLQVVGEAGDIQAAQALALTLKPDLAIVDVMLPGINGIQGTANIKAVAPATRVILVSANKDQANFYRKAAALAGAEAFLSKDELDYERVQAWKQ